MIDRLLQSAVSLYVKVVFRWTVTSDCTCQVYCSVEFSHCYLSSLLLTGCMWYWLLLTLCMEVSQHCEMTGVEALFMQARLHWSGCQVRMPDTRLPKAIFYSQLASGSRPCGHPIKRYKDSLKKNIQLCNIDPATWGSNRPRSFAVEMLMRDASVPLWTSTHRWSAAEERKEKSWRWHHFTVSQLLHLWTRMCCAAIGLC